MGYAVMLAGPRQVGLAEYADPALSAREVRIRTLFSGVSAGTEMTAYRGTNPYLNKHWDDEHRLFVEGSAWLAYPVEGWGYEEVGEVAELGLEVTRVKTGDVIWGAWGHRSTYVATEDWAAQRVLPPPLEPVLGIFSQIGSIALNAVLDADIHTGEYVAVFGQGTPGLIITQLARLNGGTVIAVDGYAKRLALAKSLGADHVLNITECDPAEAIKSLTDGRGADVSIEVAGSYRALNDAIRSTAYNSTVVSAGFFQGEASGLSLGEEFHHNRIHITCSQISGVSPRLAHRWNRVRMDRTVMRLQAEGKLHLKSLISHVFPVEGAASAFRLLDEEPGEAVQVVLKF